MLVRSKLLIIVSLWLLLHNISFAQLSVCNYTNSLLVSTVAQKIEKSVTTYGWWKLYPGYCKTLVNTPLSDEIFLHVETNPDTNTKKAFHQWGQDVEYCVSKSLSVFNIADATRCSDLTEHMKGFLSVKYSDSQQAELNIDEKGKKFNHPDLASMSFIQNMLHWLGYEGVSKATGIPGRYTLSAIRNFSEKQGICGFNLEELYPALEKEVRENDNHQAINAVHSGYDSKTILSIKQQLKNKGYEITTLNGIADINTLKQIYAFSQTLNACGLDFDQVIQALNDQ